MSPKEEIDILTAKLHHLNHAYYVLDSSEVSDYEFDKLLLELQNLENKYPQYKHSNSPTERVGGTVTKNFDTVLHKRPMLSLSNTYSMQELYEWDERVKKGLMPLAVDNTPEYICEQKFDGVAISLIYQNGKLSKAITRGDGTKGDDITANAKTIKTIPLQLKGTDWPDEIEVRGEVFFTWQSFDKLNKMQDENGEPPYANPRNTASGTLKLQDSAIVASRNLDCYSYNLLIDNQIFNTHEESINALQKWGFHISPTWKKCNNIDEVWQYINDWEQKRKHLPLATDGVVIKVNKYAHQQELGMTAKSPRWAIAYKYKSESAITELQKVTYQVGRTGAITPVANLKPVLLGGTVVKRATLHNADEIQRLDLHENDYVFVEKAGEIIPKITGIDTSKRSIGANKIQFINTCPQCSTPLVRHADEAAWYCMNETGCQPQILGKIEHFVHRKAMDIDGLGEGKLQILYENKLINNVSDLYALTYENIFGLKKIYTDEDTGKNKEISFQQKTSQNLIVAIQKSTLIPFERVLFALGIKYVGATVSEKLVTYFKSMDNIQNATLEELKNAPEIGEKIAESIYQWLRNDTNIEILSRLRAAGLQFVKEETQILNESNKLAGITMLATGTFEHFSREQIEAKIEANGARLLSGVSAKLNYLVAGNDAGPSKLEKATKLGVTIISEHDFIKMLE
ncbi:MAG: NAD-dependent DNA ligase LigA [Cytophagales bacterium]|nr:NAD-dependent DNA ligase LigA [Cytophagales bacterium]